jgi:hypothetical protein
MTTAANGERPRRRKRVKAEPDPRAHRGESAAARARVRGEPCRRCGEHHVNAKGQPTCNGHRRGVRPWKPCNKAPLRGAAVCQLHGALTPKVKQNADARLLWMDVEGEVGRLLEECDLPDQHPIDGLLEVVRNAGAMMRLLGSLCATLDLDAGEVKLAIDDANVTRYTDGEHGIYGYNTRGDQTTHILVTMWGQWADRYARACKLALDANIDERLVRNAEATSNVVFMAVERALQSANLDPAQAKAFSTTLAGELRKLVGPLDDMKKQVANGTA